MLGQEVTATGTLGYYYAQTNPVFKTLVSQLNTIINDLNVNLDQIVNIDPTKLINAISYLTQLQPLSQVQYTTNVNFYVLPSFPTPTNDLTLMAPLLDNLPKLAYFYADQGCPAMLYLKQLGTIGGTQPLANVVPSFNKKGVIFKGLNYLILQAELNLPGMIYAVAVPTGSKKPLALQIINGQNANNVLAASNSTNYTSYDNFGNLLPVRLNLSGLSSASAYDIYYLAGNYVPGYPMTSPTVYALTGAKVLNSSSTKTKFSIRTGKMIMSFTLSNFEKIL